MIWREGPVYERDDNGRPKRNNGKPVIVDRADGIFLWKCSWTVFSLLREKDVKYKGLMSRDWEIKREGSGLDDTKYFIEQAVPDGGPQPLTIADLSLAAQKYDLVALTRPKPYEVLAGSLRGQVTQDGPQPTMDRSSVLPTAQNTLGDGPSVRASAFHAGVRGNIMRSLKIGAPVALFLIAIVAANLTLTHWGPLRSSLTPLS